MAYTRFNSITRTTSPDKLKGINIPAPATGAVELLNDSMMSSLGEGVSIHINSHTVSSPINGIVLETTPSYGQVLIQAKNKLKFLLQLPSSYSEHLGLGIGCLVKKGEQVTKGQTLLTLDLYRIQQHLKPVVLHCLILDSAPFGRIQVPHKTVEINTDTIFSLIPLPKIDKQ